MAFSILPLSSWTTHVHIHTHTHTHNFFTAKFSLVFPKSYSRYLSSFGKYVNIAVYELLSLDEELASHYYHCPFQDLFPPLKCEPLKGEDCGFFILLSLSPSTGHSMNRCLINFCKWRGKKFLPFLECTLHLDLIIFVKLGSLRE